MRHWSSPFLILGAAVAALAPAPAEAQDQRDRGDPAVIERELEPVDPATQRERPNIRPTDDVTADVAAVPIDLVLGAIRLQGLRRLSPSVFGATLERFIGRPLDRSDLVQLATEVAAAARRAGFGLATAYVPQQDVVGGILTLIVEEGRIDAIRASGPAALAVERRLAALVDGRPVSTAEVEYRLMIASDMAGVWVGEAQLVREGGRSILRVSTRRDALRAWASLDNWGSDTVGPVRGRITAEANGLLGPADQLNFTGVFTPLDPEELQFLRARYAIPLGLSGTELRIGGFIGRTNLGGDIADRGLEGDSSEIELEIAHPVHRSRRSGLWLTARIGLRDSELAEQGRLIRDDRIASAGLAVTGHASFAGGRVRGRITATRGLDLFGATTRGDPLASRDGAGSVFTRVDYVADWDRSLGGGFSVELSTEGQFADRSMLSAEEMGLGGRRFIRGFDYREFSGDEGAAAAAELRFDLKDLPRAVRGVQFFAYTDVGRVTNRGDKDGSGTLASAGGGVRVRFTNRLDGEFQVGVPLTDGQSNRAPDPRFSFSLNARF